MISEIKHAKRIKRAKQIDAVVCVEVVTLVCHVLMAELPFFSLPVFFSRLSSSRSCCSSVCSPSPLTLSLTFLLCFHSPQLASVNLTCHLSLFTASIFYFTFALANEF